MSAAIDAGRHPMVDGNPPDWASAWGQDRFGVYAGFTVDSIMQIMRWVPPGRFDMGSPDDEEGRWDDEGPVHAVTIVEGFWLFDTPCTQALWQVVMGSNPSHFQDPARPVEQVNIEDVDAFIASVNALVPALELSLPSEARWEYAARAGTKTATYAGDMQIRKGGIAPVLRDIAWYNGNSGEKFDLPGVKQGTRRVAAKAANPWGLYDMLGNVWEWCADDWHGTYEGAPDDGSAWLDRDARASGAAGRVVRGGGWFYDPRFVRAAYRNRNVPDVRLNDLGFRCARVQSE